MSDLVQTRDAGRPDLCADEPFRTIPTWLPEPEALPSINVATMDDGNGPGGNNPFDNESQRPVVRARVTGPVRVSGMVVEDC